jgi:uncharacterized protein YndB with AHSA1/START domain
VRKILLLVSLLAVLGVLLFVPVAVGARRIDTSVTIDRPPQQVFDYVTTPGNWPKWHPSSLAVSGATDHSLRVGELVREEFLVAGHHGHAVWTVVASEAPHRWVIEGKVEGGVNGVVSYTLTAQGTGTAFHRQFVYSPPNGLAFILDRLFIYERIVAESTQAMKQLKAALEIS